MCSSGMAPKPIAAHASARVRTRETGLTTLGGERFLGLTSGGRFAGCRILFLLRNSSSNLRYFSLMSMA